MVHFCRRRGLQHVVKGYQTKIQLNALLTKCLKLSTITSYRLLFQLKKIDKINSNLIYLTFTSTFCCSIVVQLLSLHTFSYFPQDLLFLT